MFSLNAYELGRNKTIRGINHPNYKKCVDIINTTDDKYVLFIASPSGKVESPQNKKPNISFAISLLRS